MDALNFLKFWKHLTVTSTGISHIVLEEAEYGSDDEDSFFDLEFAVHDFDNNENNSTNKIIGSPEDQTMREREGLLVSIEEDRFACKIAEINGDGEVDVSRSAIPLSASESISKRKIHPIEPISKPQSPISLLRSSAPSFRISMFRKPREKETMNFPGKLNMEDSCQNSPSLSRANSSRSHGNKTKPERFSKDVLRKYMKLIKPLYTKVSRKYNDKMKFSDEVSTASPMLSPLASSVSSFSRKEKQGNIPTGIRVVRKHLGKNKSASSVIGAASPAKRSDDSLWEQHDGIQSAILHCKRSFNARDSSSMENDGSNM
ncbi:probable membrane-associated kinase regulator 5 [Neltuma alba]|uniref:probable membrane-associated kinase regulator 5 n=1 Tax=Neltuma alba TaxID=207710 RepID=UPI0010A59281|nr:probable membrane-associated kinase regulator 5 [Prosopis alba]